jgi:uncharacterized membrane protein (UPF0127 family)
MRIVVWRTPAEQARGLQGRPIEPDTLFVFPGVRAGGIFHSRNVLEPFDIGFLRADYSLIGYRTMSPERDVAVLPPGTACVIEAKAGMLQRLTV